MCKKYKQLIRKRINQLRREKGISEYQLSTDLGHCKGYIQSITSGRSLPSMEAFLEICDYFNITPSEFLDSSIENNTLYNELVNKIKLLSHNDLILLSLIINRLTLNSSEDLLEVLSQHQI